jgi:hypothetical protein
VEVGNATQAVSGDQSGSPNGRPPSPPTKGGQTTYAQRLFDQLDRQYAEREADLTQRDKPAIITTGNHADQRNEGIRMARTTTSKTAAKRGAPKRRTASKATTAKLDAGRRKAEKAAAPAKPARKEMVRRTHAEKIKLGKAIIARQKKGETANEIATDLQLYPFQVHQLIALVHVDNGDVPAITAKTEDVLVKRLATARLKGDEYASWDWLQARSGINKVKIQKMLVEAGVDISDVRAARKGEPAKRSRPAKTADRSRSSKAKETQRTSNRQQSAPRTRKPAAKVPAAKPVSKRRAAANSAKVRAAGKTAAAKPVKMANVDKPKRKPTGAAATNVKGKTKPIKRARRPVNVPKGARPTSDPS